MPLWRSATNCGSILSLEYSAPAHWILILHLRRILTYSPANRPCNTRSWFGTRDCHVQKCACSSNVSNVAPVHLSFVPLSCVHDFLSTLIWPFVMPPREYIHRYSGHRRIEPVLRMIVSGALSAWSRTSSQRTRMIVNLRWSVLTGERQITWNIMFVNLFPCCLFSPV